MVIQLQDAYHHWVATKYQVDTMIASAIDEADQGTPWKEEQLVNVCSPCLKFSDEDEDRTIQNTMYLNLHHAQLKRYTLWDFEMFELRYCVDYYRKMFELATSVSEQVNSILPSNACRQKYKMTDRWN
jgi:hypothetical protein